VTRRPPLPADEIRRLLVKRHAVFARAVRDAGRSPTPRRVHRSRVAARSLRAMLAVLKPWLAPRLRSRACRDLRSVASRFGDRREADVRREWLGGLAGSSGVLAPGAYRALVSRLGDEQERAGERLRRHLRSEACRARLERIEAALCAPGLVVAEEIPQGRLRKRVRRRWKALRRGLARHDTDPAALHALRIAAKKARYASETLSPLLGVDLAAPLQDLKKLQDVLGEHRDATEALGWLDRLGEPLGPVLKARLSVPVERVRQRRLRQLVRLADRIAVPDLLPRARVSGRRSRGRRPPAGGGSARPAAGRRGASR